jgi:hypothetical protein
VKLIYSVVLLTMLQLQVYAQQAAPLFRQGTIEYNIYLSEFNPMHSFKYRMGVKKIYGDKVIYSFKKGNLRYDFINEAGDTSYTLIHNRKKNINYRYAAKSDTIWATATTGEKFTPIWSKQLGDTMISGLQLKGYGVAGTNNANTKETIIFRYYFYNKLPIKSRWFKNYKEFNWHKTVAQTNCLPGHYITDYVGEFRCEYYNPKVTRKKISKRTFKLPKNKVIKSDD